MQNLVVQPADTGPVRRPGPYPQRFVFGLMAAAALVMVSDAHAQPQRASVVVLPWVAEGIDPTRPEALSATLSGLLPGLEEQGYAVADPTLLRMRLSTYGRFPSGLARGDKREFERLAHAALVAVASLQVVPEGIDPKVLAAAHAAIDQTMAFAFDRIESLGREDVLAQKILDACLLSPRLLLTEGASEQLVVMAALQCMKMSPGVRPSVAAHPPEVQAALAKAEGLNASLAPSVLHVTTADACVGCTVFLNGRPIGKTPYQSGVIPGNYRIQVEYPDQVPGTGFAHEATLTATRTTTLRIAPFETYVRESGSSWYIAWRDGSPRLAIEALADALGVDRVVIVRFTGFSYAYEMIGARGLHCAGGSTARDLEREFAHFLGGCTSAGVSVTGLRKPGASASTAHVNRAVETAWSSQRSLVTRNWGIALGVIGGASIWAAGFADWKTNTPSHLSAPALSHGLQALAGVGSGLALASEPMWIPIGRKHAPWWAWTSMALGAAQGIYGAVLWAYHGGCAATVPGRPYKCDEIYNTRVRGPVYVSGSLPMLMLPVSHYVARETWGRARSVTTTLTHGDGATRVVLQGKF